MRSRNVLAVLVLALAGTVLPWGSGVAAGAAVAECGNGDLSASYHATGAGAGSRFGRIVLRNTSATTCFVQGYGGLSYVGHGDGTQIGAAATRVPGTARRVVLEPGERAVSRVRESTAENYPRRTCRPRAVDGFRVYVPDATRSQFVAHATTGCANARVRLISQRPYRAARG